MTLGDIAKAMGLQSAFLEGDISWGSRLEIPLRDGRVLLLQEGDTDDHHWVEVLDSDSPALMVSGKA